MPNPTLPHPSPKRHSLLIFACLCHTVREALPNGCSPDGASSSLVYVAEPQDYEGARAACAARGGALANVGSLAEAYGSGWTGDPDEIWIADNSDAGSAWYDTCYTGGCPCIDCAGPSETKPFICRLPPTEPSPPANPDAGHDHGATDAQMCPITRSFCTSSPSLPNNCNCGDCGYPACGDCDCDFYGDTSCCYSNGQPTAASPTSFVVRPSPLELSPRHHPAPPLSRLRRYPLPPPLSPAPTPGDDCPSACTACRSPPNP